MDTQVIVEEIIKNLVFELEPAFTKQTNQDYSSKKGSINLMLKVRKKVITMPVSQGFISNKLSEPEKVLQKVRLFNRDGTIASFDIWLEKEYLQKMLQKHAKSLLYKVNPGLYLKTTVDKNQIQQQPGHNIHISKDESMKHQDNFLTPPKNKFKSFTNNNAPKKPKTFLGTKCKPGGCLDPPFDEDYYPYKCNIKGLSVHGSNQSMEVNPDDANIDVKSNVIYSNKKYNSKLIAPISSDESLNKSSNETCPNIILDRIESRESAIITYPPDDEKNPRNNRYTKKDKTNINRQSNNDKARQKVNDSVNSFFTPPKKYKRDSIIVAIHNINIDDKSINYKSINNCTSKTKGMNASDVSNTKQCSNINLHKIKSEKYLTNEENNIDTDIASKKNNKMLVNGSSNMKKMSESIESSINKFLNLKTKYKLDLNKYVEKDSLISNMTNASHKCIELYAKGSFKLNSNLSLSTELHKDSIKQSILDINLCKSELSKNSVIVYTSKDTNSVDESEVISIEKIDLERKLYTKEKSTLSTNKYENTIYNLSKESNFEIEGADIEMNWDPNINNANINKSSNIAIFIKTIKVNNQKPYSDTHLYKFESQKNLFIRYSAIEATNMYVTKRPTEKEHQQCKSYNENKLKRSLKSISNFTRPGYISKEDTIEFLENFTAPQNITTSVNYTYQSVPNSVSSNTVIEAIDNKFADHNILSIQGPLAIEREQTETISISNLDRLELDDITTEMPQNIESNISIGNSKKSNQNMIRSLKHKRYPVTKSCIVLDSGKGTLEFNPSENRNPVIELQANPQSVKNNILRSFCSKTETFKTDKNCTKQQEMSITNMNNRDNTETKIEHLDQVVNSHNKKDIFMNSNSNISSMYEINNKDKLDILSENVIKNEVKLNNINKKFKTISNIEQIINDLKDINQQSNFKIQQNPLHQFINKKPNSCEIFNSSAQLFKTVGERLDTNIKRENKEPLSNNVTSITRKLTSHNPSITVKSNGTVFLDLTLYSYWNDKNQRVITTIKDENKLKRHPKNFIIVIKSEIKLPLNNDYQEISAPIDSDLDMALKIRKSNNKENSTFIIKPSTTATQTVNEHAYSANILKQNGYDEIKYDTNQVDSTLTDIYEHDLLPLQLLMRNLKYEIDTLAKQRMILKKKVLCMKPEIQKPAK